MSNIEEERQELIHVAQKKEISYSLSKLKKFAQDEIHRIYEDYQREKQEKELDDLNESFTCIFISKFEEYMKKYGMIRDESEMGKRLQERKLFVADVKYFVSYVTPYLPFVGLVDGGIIVVDEILQRNKKDDKFTCNVEEGREQDASFSSSAKEE